MKLLQPHQAHAPEPWLAAPMYGAIVACQPTPGDRRPMDTEYGGFILGEGMHAANRRRILACVNACKGIPTEALEGIYGYGNPWGLTSFARLAYETARKIEAEIFPDEDRRMKPWPLELG